jgi:hypothetical protein
MLPATLSSINWTFNGACKHFVIPYLDDIIVLLLSDEEHEKPLDILRKRLFVVSLRLKKVKCKVIEKNKKTGQYCVRMKNKK